MQRPGFGWWSFITSCGIAAFAIFIAANYSSLTASNLPVGQQAVLVQVQSLSSPLANEKPVMEVSTVGSQATLITGGGGGDSAVNPLMLWRRWSSSKTLTCSASLRLPTPLQSSERSMFTPGTILWVGIPAESELKKALYDGCEEQSKKSDASAETLALNEGSYGHVTIYSGNFPRLAVLLLSVVWMACIAYGLISNGKYKGVKQLLIGKDNRYSNAQFQMCAWFFVFIAAYISTALWRIMSGSLQLAVGIQSPQALLALTGIAAGTFAIASGIAASASQQDGIIKPLAASPKLENLYTDDAGKFDFGDFQSLIVTVVAVVGYLIALAGWQEHIHLNAETILPDVGSTILTIFGAGQATYLLKKGLRTDAIRDFGLELNPPSVDVPKQPPPATLEVMTLDIWHAAGLVPGVPTITRQPQAGAAVVSVGAALPGGHAMLTQYPISIDNATLTSGTYIFNLAVSAGSRTQEVTGQFRVRP